MDGNQNINWNKIQGEYKHLMLTLPSKMGIVMIKFTKTRFRAQAWTDEGAEPWKKRSPKSKRNKGRALLIDTGRLRRSIRIISTTADSVTIGTDVPYAKAHNEGFNGTVTVRAHKRDKNTKSTIYSTQIFNIKSRKGRKSTIKNKVGEMYVKAHSRKMNVPKRQFMGKSQYQSKMISEMIYSEIKK